VEISKKVVIAGHFGVGKTSLIKRFVHEKFSDQYLTTIGVKIDKKTVEVNSTSIHMILWDIAGEQSAFKIPKNYFMGAHGLLYVFDLSREETYQNLSDQVFEITKDNPKIHTIVLGNKSDLVNESLIEEIRSETSLNFKITSAMTGENVETAFKDLAENMI